MEDVTACASSGSRHQEDISADIKNRKPRGARQRGARQRGDGLPWKRLHARRVFQARLNPDRIHHSLRTSESDRSSISGSNDTVLPRVDAAALTVPLTSQVRSPLPSPVIARLKFTRSPASCSSRYAELTPRRPTERIVTRRTSVSRNASSTIVCVTNVRALPVDCCERTVAFSPSLACLQRSAINTAQQFRDDHAAPSAGCPGRTRFSSLYLGLYGFSHRKFDGPRRDRLHALCARRQCPP